jgi:hypothetical protein
MGDEQQLSSTHSAPSLYIKQQSAQAPGAPVSAQSQQQFVAMQARNREYQAQRQQAVNLQQQNQSTLQALASFKTGDNQYDITKAVSSRAVPRAVLVKAFGEQAVAAQEQFLSANVYLPKTKEWVHKADYSKMNSVQQASLQRLGITAFNAQQQVNQQKIQAQNAATQVAISKQQAVLSKVSTYSVGNDQYNFAQAVADKKTTVNELKDSGLITDTKVLSSIQSDADKAAKVNTALSKINNAKYQNADGSYNLDKIIYDNTLNGEAVGLVFGTTPEGKQAVQAAYKRVLGYRLADIRGDKSNASHPGLEKAASIARSYLDFTVPFYRTQRTWSQMSGVQRGTSLGIDIASTLLIAAPVVETVGRGTAGIARLIGVEAVEKTAGEIASKDILAASVGREVTATTATRIASGVTKGIAASTIGYGGYQYAKNFSKMNTTEKSVYGSILGAGIAALIIPEVSRMVLENRASWKNPIVTYGPGKLEVTGMKDMGEIDLAKINDLVKTDKTSVRVVSSAKSQLDFAEKASQLTSGEKGLVPKSGGSLTEWIKGPKEKPLSSEMGAEDYPDSYNIRVEGKFWTIKGPMLIDTSTGEVLATGDKALLLESGASKLPSGKAIQLLKAGETGKIFEFTFPDLGFTPSLELESIQKSISELQSRDVNVRKGALNELLSSSSDLGVQPSQVKRVLTKTLEKEAISDEKMAKLNKLFEDSATDRGMSFSPKYTTKVEAIRDFDGKIVATKVTKTIVPETMVKTANPKLQKLRELFNQASAPGAGLSAHSAIVASILSSAVVKAISDTSAKTSQVNKATAKAINAASIAAASDLARGISPDVVSDTFTSTVTKAINKSDLSPENKTNVENKLQTITQNMLQTQTKLDTTTKTGKETETGNDLLLPSTSKDDIKSGKKSVPKGTVVWPQGQIRQGTHMVDQWWVWMPPYEPQSEYLFPMSKSPTGAKKVTGLKSAYETIKLLKSRNVPETLSTAPGRLGIVNLEIKKGQKARYSKKPVASASTIS